jgi:peptidylprolyl isomerase
MLNKRHLLSLASASLILTCSSACGDSSGPKTESKKEIATNTTTDSVQLKTPDQVKTPDQTVNLDAPISKEEITKVSEAFGNFVGRNLKSPGVTFELESIIKGMRDGFAGKPSPLNDKDYEALMGKIQQQAYKQLSAENLKAADEFLAKNAKEDKIIVIEPGKLEYKIIKEGTGETVKEHNSPQIQYEGKFLDGKSFGSSKDAGGPITIPLDQTIPGFSKGILGMKEGEKRILYVHPDLGYGTTGHLPPNSLLIFEIELVKANAPESTEDMDDLSEELSLADDEDYLSDSDEDTDDEDIKIVSPTGEKK